MPERLMDTDWTEYAKNICQAHNKQEFFNMIIDKVKKLEDQVAELQEVILEPDTKG